MQDPHLGEYTIPLYEDLARVHGPIIVSQIDIFMGTIIRTLTTRGSSFPLQQACSKVAPTIARYAIGPNTLEEENKRIIRLLCKPLSDSILGSQESLSCGAALCLNALVECDNWRFASDDMVNEVYLKVAGDLKNQKWSHDWELDPWMNPSEQVRGVLEAHSKEFDGKSNRETSDLSFSKNFELKGKNPSVTLGFPMFEDCIWVRQCKKSSKNCGILDAHHVFVEMPIRGFIGSTYPNQLRNALLLLGNCTFDPGIVEDWFYSSGCFSKQEVEQTSPNHNVFPSPFKSGTTLRDLRVGESDHGCVLRLGLVADLFPANALLNMYAKWEALEDNPRNRNHTPDVLDETPHRVVRKNSGEWVSETMTCRDLVSWNVIAGNVQQGKHEEALQMMWSMDPANLKPDFFTLSSILPIFAEYADVCRGKEIQGYALNGHPQDSISLFTLMQKDGLEPTYVAFVAVLTARAHARLADAARRYFCSMKHDYGVTLGVKHFTAVADVLRRASRLQEAKIPAVLDYLGTIIEAGCKFLIFAHHQSMIDSIHKFLLKKKVGCIRIDGSTPPTSRQSLVVDFREKESIKAAVLSIKAAGVGLKLTAASTVIFAALSWTPGKICLLPIFTADRLLVVAAIVRRTQVPANDEGDHVVQAAHIIYFILAMQSHVSRLFLVIVPSSSISKWEAEFHFVAPSVNPLVYNGNRDARTIVYWLIEGIARFSIWSCCMGIMGFVEVASVVYLAEMGDGFVIFDPGIAADLHYISDSYFFSRFPP